MYLINCLIHQELVNNDLFIIFKNQVHIKLIVYFLNIYKITPEKI